jgi:prefoldin alpha subunit
MSRTSSESQRRTSKTTVESPEEEVRRLIVELRLLEGTAETLQSRIKFLNDAFAELSLTSKTLEGIEKEKVDAPILVPIGGGSYIKASLTDVDRVVYGVGAGVAIEKTLKEAKEGIANRLAQIERTRQTLEQQLAEVLNKIQEDQNRLRELSASLRSRER